jgi:hypothetical protein
MTEIIPKMAGAGKLLRLRTRCPSCGSTPALRITERVARDAGAYESTEPLATYQCQRRRCGAVYVLSAHAYQNAS